MSGPGRAFPGAARWHRDPGPRAVLSEAPPTPSGTASAANPGQQPVGFG